MFVLPRTESIFMMQFSKCDDDDHANKQGDACLLYCQFTRQFQVDSDLLGSVSIQLEDVYREKKGSVALLLCAGRLLYKPAKMHNANTVPCR